MSILRVVARCVGAAAVGAASAPTGALCHVSSPANARDQLAASSNVPQKELSSASELPSKPLVISSRDEAEDSEYYVQEDWTGRPVDHLVFSPAPTKEEVEEATKDLHAALHLSIPVSGSLLDGSSEDPFVVVSGSRSQEEDPGLGVTVIDKQEVRDTSFKLSSRHMGMLAAGSSVYQAFNLLRNPQVQGAVRSLACDPAVWKAVVNNEKVQELTKSLQNIDEMSSQNELPFAEGVNDEINFFLKLASRAVVHITAKILQLLDKIVEIVGNILESVEKSFLKKDACVIDKTVAACLMLAVVVIFVVLIKRALPK